MLTLFNSVQGFLDNIILFSRNSSLGDESEMKTFFHSFSVEYLIETKTDRTNNHSMLYQFRKIYLDPDDKVQFSSKFLIKARIKCKIKAVRIVFFLAIFVFIGVKFMWFFRL